LTPTQIESHFGDRPQLAVVRCVDEQGRKLTALWDAGHFQQLLISGVARDPAGRSLTRQGWPVMLPGWRAAS